MKNETLRAVTVLTVIAVICGIVLSVMNALLYVPPSLDDLSKNFAGEWTAEELNLEFSKSGGGSVTIVGKTVKDGKEVIGLVVKANSSGKYDGSKVAVYIDKSTDTIIDSAVLSAGSTGGFTLEYAEKNSDGKLKSYADYKGVKITSSSFNEKYDGPKTGATKTVTGFYDTFEIVARYYYNVYAGGKS